MTHVLAFTDFTPVGELGIEIGLRLAQSLGGRLTVVHVADSERWGTWGREGTQGAEDAHAHHAEHAERELLAIRLRAGRTHAGVEVMTQLRTGEPVATILAAVDADRPDFVAMGTHGRGRWSRAALGSPATAVLRHAKVPLISARLGEPHRDWTKLLVPFDFGPASRDALDMSVALARKLRATLRLLLVSPGSYDLDLAPSSSSLADVEGATQAALQSVVDDYPTRDVPMDIAVRFGNAASEVAAETESWQAGLVVVGTHDQAPDPFFAEGVAQGTARLASCPVVTCPQRGR